MTTGQERLGPADEVNLLLDRGDSVYVVTVAGLLGTGGFVDERGGVDIEALRDVLSQRITAVPRLQRRLEGAPGRHWLVDTQVDARTHVRVTEPVEGLAGFEHLCARLSGARLPLERPLWEFLIVPNSEATPVGWVFRVHHALADGTTAARMLDLLFDPDEAAGNPSQPASRPTTRGRSVFPGYWLAFLRAMSRRLPRTALLGPLGPDRTLRFVSVSLDAAHRAAHAAGGTINDAVLAVAGGGARAAYAAMGEIPPVELPVSVPVQLSGHDGKVNQVSAVVVPVPLAAGSTTDRLRAVAERTHRVVPEVRSSPLPWFARTRAGGRVMRWYAARQRMIGLFATNGRGPERPRSLCGAPVATAWALPVLGGNVRVGLAAVSYAGRLAFCLLWSDALGDVGEAFADGIQEATAELR